MSAKTLALSGLMGLVALVAVNLWTYKQIYETVCVEVCTNSMDVMMSLCVLGLLPSSTLIVVKSTLLLDHIRRSGEGKPFLLGFVVNGLIAALSFVFVWWLAYESLLEIVPLQEVAAPIEGEWAEHLGLLLFSCLASVPQFIMAVVGGLVFRRLGINVHRSTAQPALGPSGGASDSPNLALPRTRPAAALSGRIKVTLGGPVR